MKDLAALLRAKYEKSATGKRAQIRNDLLVRQKEIVAELAKGWSVRAIWEVLPTRSIAPLPVFQRYRQRNWI